MTVVRAFTSVALVALLAACSGPAASDAVVPVAQSEPVDEQVAKTASFAGPDLDADEPAPPASAPPNETTSSSHVPLKYLIGDVDPAKDPKFARIPEKYLGGSRVWGHKDAVAAFVRMADDAAANGYELKAVSAFRSF
ncbi:MAG: hypothetical protein EON93_25660, partial [Burkholderiales bacterium]